MDESGSPRGPDSGAFVAGAERLARVARIIREHQSLQTRKPEPPVVPFPAVQNPEDVWERKYMHRTIRPLRRDAAEVPNTGTGLLEALQNPPFPAATAAEPSQDLPETRPLGLAIGKGLRKTSWFGRLLGR